VTNPIPGVCTDAEAVVGELFRTPEGRRDPYPRYRRLRELAPVHRSASVRGWLLTRYADCSAALRDPRLQNRYEEALDARSSRWRTRPSLVWAGRTLVNMDGPAHAQLRRRVIRWFTPRTVERLRPMVDGLLDGLAGGSGGDLMTRLAFPLPIGVIGMLLGVPAVDLPPFRDRVFALTAAFEIGAAELMDGADQAAIESLDYFGHLIDDRRRHPGDDLLSHLVSTGGASGEEQLSDGELIDFALILLVAGFETTTHLIGNGVLALLDQPDQISLLREQPERCSVLPDELLRHSGPVQFVTRFTCEAVPFGDSVIPADEAVFMMLGAANRDPDRYRDPDRLDVTRTDIHPLAFGGGVHFCLGAALARLEIEVVFRRLLDRFSLIELEGARPDHRDRLSVRGPTAVPVALGARATRMPADAATPGPGARPAGHDEAWRQAFRRRAEEIATKVDAAELRARVALLERLPLFSACDPAELAWLAATAYPLAFDAGDTLCEQGADSPDCYLIAAGEALVTVDGVQVATAGADDVVGERGPIEGRSRSATVTATTHMITYAISRERLQELLRTNPTAAEHMRRSLAARYGS
jgi:cytochrome P450